MLEVAQADDKDWTEEGLCCICKPGEGAAGQGDNCAPDNGLMPRLAELKGDDCRYSGHSKNCMGYNAPVIRPSVFLILA